jgi:flagellar assembly protein FliH
MQNAERRPEHRGYASVFILHSAFIILHFLAELMAVIKPTAPASVLTPFSIRDIEIEAQTLLLRARRAAEVLLGEAKREGEQMRAKAKAEGFSQGRLEGVRQGTEEGRKTGHEAALAEIKPQLAQTLTALSAVMKQLDAARHDLESAGIHEVVKLATSIARRVTKRQAAIDPLVLTENVKEAMKLAVQAADVQIIIHPKQRETLLSELPRLKMEWPSVKHVELIEDEAVGMGGCRIMTRQGEIDARIDEQLDRVIADLAGNVDE